MNFTKSHEANSEYPSELAEEKQNVIPIESITISSMGESSGNQNALRQMEPCLFDNNFGQFGYFTQDCSNLTVYLNDTNLLNTENKKNDATSTPTWLNVQNLENFPYFNQNTALDFSFIGANVMPMSSIHIDGSASYLNVINGNIDNDAPEYVDINKLVLPQECLPTTGGENKKKSNTVPPFLKRNRKPKNKNDKENIDKVEDLSTDDDVIFVKEYINNEGVTKENKEKVVTKKQNKILPEPRRNPRRQVQLQKISYELANKLSMEDYYQNSRKSYTSAAKRQSKASGAIFSTPSPLNHADYKEWPVEGMHEKPTFNPITKKIEKLPKAPKPLRLRTNKSMQQVKKKTTNVKHVKRKINKQEISEMHKEFSSMTHNMLHYTLNYVQQLKDYNDIAAEKDLELSSINKKNFDNAIDILKDSSILYYLANGIIDKDLAIYIRSIANKDSITEHLKDIINDYEKYEQ